MLLPCERFITFNLFIQKSPDDILRTLNTKFLVKNLARDHIVERQQTKLALIAKRSGQNWSKDKIIDHLEIRELLEHHYVRPDKDMQRAYAILAWLPLRNEVDTCIISGIPIMDIPDIVLEKLSVPISVRAIDMYSKYFWSTELNAQQWYWFLSSHDPLNYAHLVRDPIRAAYEQQYRMADEVKKRDFAQLNFVAAKSFKRLEEHLAEGEDDPDTCAKWLKIYTTVKDRAEDLRAATRRPEDSLLEVGMTDLPDIQVKSAEDFITKTVLIDPEAENKDAAK